MERSTGKTMDCFIEVPSVDDATQTLLRHESLLDTSKPPKIGTRHVMVELASQGDLMKELFPRAKDVIWSSQGVPTVLKNTDVWSHGFRGFFTTEEMSGLVRHAEFPNRVSFQKLALLLKTSKRRGETV